MPREYTLQTDNVDYRISSWDLHLRCLKGHMTLIQSAAEYSNCTTDVKIPQDHHRFDRLTAGSQFWYDVDWLAIVRTSTVKLCQWTQSVIREPRHSTMIFLKCFCDLICYLDYYWWEVEEKVTSPFLGLKHDTKIGNGMLHGEIWIGTPQMVPWQNHGTGMVHRIKFSAVLAGRLESRLSEQSMKRSSYREWLQIVQFLAIDVWMIHGIVILHKRRWHLDNRLR